VTTDEPTPKTIRAAVPKHLREPSLWFALGVTVAGLAYYAFGIALFVLDWSRVGGVVVSGFAMSALFVIGHEAQHLHFSGSKRLDTVISYLCLLPTWHAVRITTYAHVKLHHRYTNVRGYDPQWPPLSREAYDALPRYRRLLERFYRTWWGFGLYWTIEVVFLLGLHPRGPWVTRLGNYRYALDRTITVGFIAANVAMWIWIAPHIGVTGPVAIGGYVASVLVAHWVIGWATYFQHTNVTVRWYATPEQWSFYGSQITGTQDFFLGMRHNAHHIDMTIPAVHLGAAQRSLQQAFSETLVVMVCEMPGIVRACKLYDFERQIWTDFPKRA
jgi:omega-6 fatty acid desaturase (delta-12 desaturase)